MAALVLGITAVVLLLASPRERPGTPAPDAWGIYTPRDPFGTGDGGLTTRSGIASNPPVADGGYLLLNPRNGIDTSGS